MISRRHATLPALAATAAVVPRLDWWIDHGLLLAAFVGLTAFAIARPERETLLLLSASALGVAALSQSSLHMMLVTLIVLAGIGTLSWPLGRNGIGGLSWIGLTAVLVILALGGNRTEELADPAPSAPETTSADTPTPRDDVASETIQRPRSNTSDTGSDNLIQHRPVDELLELLVLDSAPSSSLQQVPRAEPGLDDTDNPSWLATIVLVALALAAHRLLNRSKELVLTHTDGSNSAASTSGLTRRFERAGASVGLHRGQNETLLAYGHRLAEETGDDRFRRCADLLSAHLYSNESDANQLEVLLKELRDRPSSAAAGLGDDV